MRAPLQNKKEEWKNKIVLIEKEHNKQFKKMRRVVKKKGETLNKVEKKMKKSRNTEELTLTRNNVVSDLQEEIKNICVYEKDKLKEISCQERLLYTRVAAGLKPVILCEFAMCREMEQLDQVMEDINKIIMDPFKENNDNGEEIFFVNGSDSPYLFTTPPSTPAVSSTGSRRSSLRSVNSFSRSSSVAGSVVDDTGSFRSRNNSVSSHQVNNLEHQIVCQTFLFCRVNNRGG